MTTDLRYPIGRFTYERPYTEQERADRISEIEQLPLEFRHAFEALHEGELDTPYRPGGWTARQLVHHLPESHMNSYIRFKLAMTESEPTVKRYDEGLWAIQPDVATTPLEVSLKLLEALHARWVPFLRAMRPEDWGRRFRHPEDGLLTLDRTVGYYAWHGRHHTAHLQLIRSAGAL